MTTRRRHAVLIATSLGAFGTLTACGGGGGGDVRAADGSIAKPGSWSVFDLRAGDCLAPPKDLKGEIADIAVVPCAQPHRQEVFGMVKHTADAFPGAATLTAFADAGCIAELQKTYKVSPSDGYFVSYLLPSFDSWNKENDRSITCVLVFPNEGDKAGSTVARLRAQVAPTATTLPATAGKPGV